MVIVTVRISQLKYKILDL